MAEAVADAPGTTTGAPAAGTTTAPSTDGLTLLDWRGSLPADLRSDPVLQQFPHLEGAAKTLVSQQKMLGRALFVPEQADDADGWGKVYAKLGRPETSADYAVPEVELPEGMAFDGEFMRGLKEVAHASGMSQRQFDQVVAFSGQTLRQGANLQGEALARSLDDGQRELAKRFGASAPRMVERASAFFEHMSGPAREKFAASPLANDPDVVEAFAQWFDRLGEGEFFDSDHYQPGTNTAETLDKRLDELTAKEMSPGGLTPGEQQEKGRVAQQLVRARERAQAGGRRG